MSDGEDELRRRLQDPRWGLPAWDDAEGRIRRAARRDRRLRVTGIMAVTVVLLGGALAGVGLSRRPRQVNVVAPIHLIQLVRPKIVVNITSDAAKNAYPNWGGYAASKAALEHASRILAAERPDMRVLVIDPGDMNTEMHALAEPGVDLSHLPLPDAVAPRIVHEIAGEIAA